MKVKMIILSLFLFNSIGLSNLWADDISDLRKEIENMRREYESRITLLERQVEKLEQEKQYSVYEEDEGSIGIDKKNPFGFGNVTLGGYVDTEFENFKNSNSTFDQHRFIINIAANLSDRVKFYSEYEIEHGGPNASGTGEAKVEQAWIDYLINEKINLRAGALLMPFGRYNLYHDSDLQDLTDRPLVTRDIIPTTWTESGIGFHGEFDIINDWILGYETYVVNGFDSGFSDTGLRGSRGSIKSDNNNNKAVIGRVTLEPALNKEIGVSGYRGKYNDSESISGLGVDFFSRFGDLELLGEYATFLLDNPAGINIADKFWGYYLQANYHFWPSFLDDTFLGRSFEEPTFTLVGRYGKAKINDDSDAGDQDNEEDRYTLGVNYRPVESWVLKFEYQWNETKNESLERGDNDGFMASIAMGF